MGILRTILKTAKVLQHDQEDEVDLTLAASWVGATDLGDLKGKPFIKLTWDPVQVETQRGQKAYNLTGKFETSSLDITTSATLTTLQAMRNKNVSILCTPVGTVGAENPIIIIKDFGLMLGGELNYGDTSSLKLSGEKPVYDESDLYLLRITELTPA